MESEGLSLLNSTVLFSAFAGACVLLLMYIIKLYSNADPKQPEKSKNEKLLEQADKKKDNSSKAKKKGSEGRWTSRADKQTFTHPWLLTSLKGHTSQVLDMDYSSNGKYLASCGEEDPDPGGCDHQHLDAGNISTSSETRDSSSSPPSSNPSPRNKGLSRRQRKNRKREDLSPPDSGKKKPKKKSELPTLAPLKHYIKLNLAELDLARFFGSYVLSIEQLLTLGYPLESSAYPGKAIIFKSSMAGPNNQRYSKANVSETRFDVNAQEFVPGMDYAEIKAEWKATHDSGQGSRSGSSSDSGEVADDTESSSSGDGDDEKKRFVQIQEVLEVKTKKKLDPSHLLGDQHTCVRCKKTFFIKNSKYLTHERCRFHWGKLQNVLMSSLKHGYGFATEYTCCKGKPDSRGCTTCRLHVWNGVEAGFNGPLDSYVVTKHRKSPPPEGHFGVYALDCEMCYTVGGLELAKVTVVGTDGRLVYDSFVKPENEIIDYNTRFSGITARDLTRKSSKTLREVQNDLMGFINASTILIGHGLENDLRALRIMHYSIIDTAMTFPHYNGLPFRRSLKSLTSSILRREIQCGVNGHNSYEDARACMELMLWRVRKEFRSLLEHCQ